MKQRIGLLLLPGFHLLELAGVADALRASQLYLDANGAYEPVLVSLDGAAVRSSQGLTLAVHGALGAARGLQGVLVVASQLPDPDSVLLPLLRQGLVQALAPQAPVDAVLGGVGSGMAWLAPLGWLDGQRCAVRWEHLGELAERHPALVVTPQLHAVDERRLSCAGGSASLDMCIHWLGLRHGRRLAQELARHFGLASVRDGQERQDHSRSSGLAASSKLTEALALMEANLAEPLATEDVARLVGVSRRQLERLFKQHLGELPSRWYSQLRLARARRLLQESSQSILQIGLACGFASGPHFSRAYRAQFGHTPREARASRAAAWRAAPTALRPGDPSPAGSPSPEDPT